MIDNLLMIFSISGIVLGILACSLVLFSNKISKHSNWLLLLMLIVIVSVFLAIFLFEWKADLYAYIYRLPSPLLYTLFPAAYLYTRSITKNEEKFAKKNIFHFVPALVYLAGIIPHYFSTYTYRLHLVREIKNHPSRLIYLNDGILPKYCNLAFLCLQGAVYILLIAVLLKKEGMQKGKIRAIKANVDKWMKVFVFSSAAIIIPLVYLFFSPEQFSNTAFQILLLTTIISFLTIHLFLFFKPQILYGLVQMEIEYRSSNIDKNIFIDVPEKVELATILQPEENCLTSTTEICDDFSNLECYKPILEEHMFLAKPFLKQGYSITDLSNEINIPQHHLSLLLNRTYKLRFTDYINGMRIQYISENFANPKWENLTLEGIAKQAGFTSRTTFFNAIKKTAGIAPSEFMAQLKKQQSKN